MKKSFFLSVFLLFFIFGTNHVFAATAIYRSVGAGATTALVQGGGNAVTVSGSVATFASPIPDNVGVGDAFVFASNTATDTIGFITSRTSSTTYVIATAAGGAMATTTTGSTNIWSIYRAYTGLQNVLSGTENTGIPTGVRNFDTYSSGNNIVTANQQWNIALYGNGTTADTGPADFSSLHFSTPWTTDATRYVRLYTATSTSEVGTPQRAVGSWDTSKYHITSSEFYGTIILPASIYIQIDGVQIENTKNETAGQNGDAIYMSPTTGAGSVTVTNSIMQKSGSAVDGYNTAMGPDTTDVSSPAAFSVTIVNNIIYGFYNNLRFTNFEGQLYIYNNTIVSSAASVKGIVVTSNGNASSGSTKLYIKNNISTGHSGGDYSITNAGAGGNLVQTNNLSLDATAAGTNAKINKTVLFTSTSTLDYHLSLFDTAAKDQGSNLSADASYAFSTDIDGDLRTAPWDIGADEIANASSSIYNFGFDDGTGGSFVNSSVQPFLTAANTPWTLSTTTLASNGTSSVQEIYPTSNLNVGGAFFYILPTPTKSLYVRFMYRQSNPFNANGGVSNWDQVKVMRLSGPGFTGQLGSMFLSQSTGSVVGGLLGTFADLEGNVQHYSNVNTPSAPNMNSFLGQWTCLEGHWDISTNNALHFQGWINGEQYYDYTVAQPNNGDTYGVVQFDGTVNSMQATSTAWYDDIGVSTSRIGCGAPVLDTTPPVVTMSTPADGSNIAGTSVLLTASTTDNVGTVGVQFKLDTNTNLGSEITGSGLLVATTTFDSNLISNASHTIIAVARDAAGNYSTSTAVTVTVANAAAPVISAGMPSGNLSAGTSAYDLEVTTNVNSTCKYSSTANTPYASMATTFVTTGGTDHLAPITGLTNGSSYTYYIRCTASGSNDLTDYPITFSVKSNALATPDLINNGSFESDFNGFVNGSLQAPVGVSRATDTAYDGSTSIERSWVPNPGVDTGAQFFYVFPNPLNRVWVRFYFKSTAPIETVMKFARFFHTGFNGGIGGGYYGHLTTATTLLTFGFDSENSGIVNPIGVTDSQILDGQWHELEYDYWRNGDPSGYPSAAFWFDGKQVYEPDGTSTITFACPVGGNCSNAYWSNGRLYAGERAESAPLGEFGWAGILNQNNTTTGQMNFDDVSFSTLGRIGDATTTTDTFAPAVTMTAPTNGATVSGSSVALTATTTDDTATVGVQFKLDTNTNIGTEIATSSVGTATTTWDTSGVSNGSHTIIAVARDAAGNYATSSAVTVTVNNIVAPSYTYYRSISIDHTKVGSTDQTNFPALVSGTYNYLATVAHGGKVQNSSGYDIGFYADSACTSKLNWETETYTASNGTILDWVNIPTVSHTVDTVFYLCYGSSAVTTDQSNKTGTWDSGYKGVWHLPDGTSLSANDSTSNGNNGTLNNSPTAVAGKVDGAANFTSAGSQGVSISAVPSMAGATKATWEAWFKRSTINAPVYWGKDDPAGLDRFAVEAYNNGTVYLPLATNSASTYGSFVLNDTAWHKLDVVYDGTQPTDATRLVAYVDGASTTVTFSGTITTALGSSGPIYFGRSVSAGGPPGGYSDGSLDEVRLSVGTARSADWITTEYNNQSSTSTFYTIGSQQLGTDTTAPSVVMTIPANGATVSGSSVALTATTTDDVATVGVQFKLDTNTNIGTEIATSSVGTATTTWDSTGVADGTHTIIAVARDAAGNRATSTAITVTVDNTAPVRSSGAPTGTLALGTTATTLSLTTDENATCKYSASPGTSYGSMTAFGTTGGTSHSTAISGLSNGGSYSYYVKCQDGAGNINASDYTISFSVAADVTAPTVAMTAPAAGTVSGTTVAVSATASDNVGVVGVQFKIDGANLSAEHTSSPYGITWDTTGALDGSHTLVAVARDAAGNYATSSSVVVTVDNTAPVRSSGSPSGTLPINTNSTTLSLTTDESATCKYSTSSGVAYGSMTNTFTTTGGASHSSSISGLSNAGSYIYYVRCQDGQGNTDITDFTISFTVQADVTAPVVNMTAPANNATVTGSSVSVTANATDDVLVSGVQFKLDTNTNIGAEDTSFPYTVTWDSTGVADGTHTIIAVARDGSGNYSTSSVATITVDNTPPVRSGAGPSGSLTAASSETLSLTTDESATCKYSTSSGVAYGSMTNTFSVTGATTHSTSVSVTPNNSYTYYVRCSDPSGNVDGSDTTITFTVLPDVTAPTVSLTAPSNGATIGGGVNISASASDNIGVVGVQFKLDGALLGVEDTSAPYATTWNSTVVPDGTYTLLAVARDAAGNISTSTAVTINVSAAAAIVPDVVAPPPPGTSEARREANIAAITGHSLSAQQLSSTEISSLVSVIQTTPIVAVAIPVLIHSTDLTVGNVSTNVRSLQNLLITLDLGPAGDALKAHRSTAIFGPLTRAALAEFQQSVGITPAVGYFGPITRAYIENTFNTGLSRN